VRSLRGQLILLLIASVLGALSVLAWLSGRTAKQEFTKSIQRMRVEASTAPHSPRIVEEAFDRGGWSEVNRVLAAEGEESDEGRLLVFDTLGRMVHSPRGDLSAARITLLPNDAVRLEMRSGENTARVELIGGAPVRNAAGTIVGRAFPLPREAGVPIELVSEFSTGLNKRLWLGVAGLLLLTTAAGVMLGKRLLDPLAALTTAAVRVGDGDYAARVGKVPVRELEPLAAAFDAMAAGLERSEQLRRRVIRDVAHELRTPLTNLRGQIESLQDRLREPTDESFESLHEETMLLERLVGDLDALARSDAGELEVAPADLDLTRELQRAIEGFTQSGRVPRGRLELDGETGIQVRADRERLGQVIRNLIENALTHGASTEPIVVRTRRIGEMAEIAVEDRGAGIAPEHLGRVFERLYRPDPSRARASGGAGLGLAIVKALVEAQGGEVGIESEPGRGTRVFLRLPVTKRRTE
jgi:signal transduction histidine kinase